MSMSGYGEARILIIGGRSVGKTTLADVLQNNTIKRERRSLNNNNSLPRGREEYPAQVTFEGQGIEVTVIDCQMRAGSVTNSYLHQVKTVVLMFEIGSRESFNELPIWLANLQHLPNKSLRNIPESVILVGNKRDRPNIGIQRQLIDRFCEEHSIRYVAIDCHTGSGVAELKGEIARKVHYNTLSRKPSMDALEEGINNSKFQIRDMTAEESKKKKFKLNCAKCKI